ncbi:MAG: hypothetical protein IIU07_01330, partial [Lachnospiraceae bacterium]|nr:hypothetical protein [Lachnospiraceae bacterium]
MQTVPLIFLDVSFVAGDKCANVAGFHYRTIRITLDKHLIAVVEFRPRQRARQTEQASWMS